MIPILYDKATTTFDHLGIGPLIDCISCKCEQSDSNYQLTFEYPVDGIHFEDIKLSNWVKVVVPPRYYESPQLFFIVNISKVIKKRVTVVCWHISYWMKYMPLYPLEITAPHELFVYIPWNIADQSMYEFGPGGQATRSKFPFNFSSDIEYETIETLKTDICKPVMEVLGGSDNSLLGKVGGYFIWDNYNVQHKMTYPNRGYVINYGRNIIDLSQEENGEELITGITPYWIDPEDETNIVVCEPPAIYASNARDYSFQRVIGVDMSEYYEEQPTEQQLRQGANYYIWYNHVGLPKISIDINFIELSKTDEFKNFTDQPEIHLYDEVTVKFPDLNIDTQAYVTQTTYDVLKERYETVHVGEQSETVWANMKKAMDSIVMLHRKHIENLRSIYQLRRSREEEPDEEEEE